MIDQPIEILRCSLKNSKARVSQSIFFQTRPLIGEVNRRHFLFHCNHQAYAQLSIDLCNLPYWIGIILFQPTTLIGAYSFHLSQCLFQKKSKPFLEKLEALAFAANQFVKYSRRDPSKVAIELD